MHAGGAIGQAFLFEQAMLTGVAVSVCRGILLFALLLFLAFGGPFLLFAQFDASFFWSAFFWWDSCLAVVGCVVWSSYWDARAAWQLDNMTSKE